MSTAQLTAELFRQMSLIVEDEGKLKRALKALKRITTPKTDPTLMTKEEFTHRVKTADQGPTATMQQNENLTDFLKRQGYAI
ncbi:MAG: hypothetical protein IJ775_02110 [Muribaculaceae bacterium]|nr:hypothetical protein [Muribaculaceae bacterium]